MKSRIIILCSVVSPFIIIIGFSECSNNASSKELFESKEFETLYENGKEALKSWLKTRFEEKLNKTIEQKDMESDQKRISEDYNQIACAVMMIRWHIEDEFKENVEREEKQNHNSNGTSGSTDMWVAYIEHGSTKVATNLQTLLGNNSENYEKFAFSMIKMYKLCDAYMRSLPEAMRIIKEYNECFRSADLMLRAHGNKGPSYQFLKEDMNYVNMLLSARNCSGIGWVWVDEKNNVVKPQAPMETCVNPRTTEKPLMYYTDD